MKQKEIFEKESQAIIERGGSIVKVPIIEKVRGKNIVVGKEKGIVRLEKAMSKKGNEYWKVVEVYGATNGLKVGDNSPLDMRSFPVWLRESVQ